MEPQQERGVTLEHEPDNNEMKRTKPAMARMARSSPLISVFDGLLGL
jgi:hypothetical protein